MIGIVNAGNPFALNTEIEGLFPPKATRICPDGAMAHPYAFEIVPGTDESAVPVAVYRFKLVESDM